jgi:hypothetical protein
VPPLAARTNAPRTPRALIQVTSSSQLYCPSSTEINSHAWLIVFLDKLYYFSCSYYLQCSYYNEILKKLIFLDMLYYFSRLLLPTMFVLQRNSEEIRNFQKSKFKQIRNLFRFEQISNLNKFVICSDLNKFEI